jgi:ABC-type glycerol-3-phosphate transport system substrate-binding protein
MFRSCRRLFLLAGAFLLSTLVTLPGSTAAMPAHDATVTLTIMTNANMMAGLTPQTAGEGGSGSISSWYHYYGALWHKQFPNVQIKEIFVPGANGSNVMSLEATKTILAVNAGNPPDLIGTDNYLGLLVGRHALMNLDDLYQRAGIAPSYFLPAMASFARVNGHWYGLPGASNPSASDILYIPQLVKAAGLDPNNIPRTWSGLWAATQKVTTRDSKGNLERIGIPVGGPSTDQINLFCGYYASYDPATAKFHADLPCIKDYFSYELRLLNFYGGVAKYTKFTSGDPTVWSCSSKAYIPTGKILFAIDAYWSGGQMDTCYNRQWALSPAPTPHGTPAEARAVRTAAWLLAIPRGAKNPQLAFDFVRFTNWENGYLMGPTTNGYVKAGQGAQWASTFDQVEAKIRASHHYPGNPMMNALQVVIKESAVGQVSVPNDVANSYYNDQLTRAWQQMEYGRATVDQALNQVQQLVDTQQRLLHAQESS